MSKLDFKLKGEIQCVINNITYIIFSDGINCTMVIENHEFEVKPFETFTKALTHLRKINSDNDLRLNLKKEKSDTLEIRHIHYNTEKLFDENLATKIRPMLTYYKKKYARNYKTNFVFIEGIRKFKVTRIQ
jgi:hypothetical protein